MTVTKAELTRANKRAARLQAQAQLAVEERNQLIRQALNDGWTQADIARHLHLTTARLAQIATRARGNL